MGGSREPRVRTDSVGIMVTTSCALCIGIIINIMPSRLLPVAPLLLQLPPAPLPAPLQPRL